MTRRTPRRRISPRTIKRYRAIKNFVRRALGSSFQPDIKTNSSVCVSVLDLRQKIHGIEQQLNSVSKHCQDLASLESQLKLRDNIDSDKDSDIDTVTKVNKTADTQVRQKISDSRCEKPINSKSTPNIIDCNNNDGSKGKMIDQNYFNNYKENRKGKHYHKLAPIQESEQTLRTRRNHTASRTLPAAFHKNYYQSPIEPRNCEQYLDAGYSEAHRQRTRKKIEYLENNNNSKKVKKEHRCGDYKNKSHRNKNLNPELDQDYIAEIIRRQYRPVKLLGRRESEFSQFSAPVCRDQEIPTRETLEQGSDLCSCFHGVHRRHRHTTYMCNNDLSDVRSICDTRLYSSRKHKHHTNCRKRTDDLYNDTAMYDVIPVKEKCSPKSRKKFVEDNILMQDKYREVPPSPRSQRPQLNLQTRYQPEDDDDDGVLLEKQLRYMKRLHQKAMKKKENISNMSSEVFNYNRHFNGIQNSQIPCKPKPYNEECIGTVSSLQYPLLTHDQAVINNDTTLNTHTTDVSGDKTDKTLNEIKDILQNFLQEIKKESLKSEKLNSSVLSNVQNMTETQNQINTNSFHNNNNCIGHCSMPPLMQSFPNSCCYPIVPVCPVNCMQNGYVLPSPSFTCPACVNNSKERTFGSNDSKNKTNISEDASSETKKLIKEIHNLISQNPNAIQKKGLFKNNMHGVTNNNTETKILTSRSVGGSSRESKHDAKVGPSKIKSHSKSCEAIGSREATYTRYAANNSYSDTVLEKGSGVETITESTSESQYSSESTAMDKVKENKFKKMLRSIGILKKNKRDLIEELGESESSVEAQRPMQKPPFPQHIINYNMHGQEYFNHPINPHQLHHHQNKYYGHPPGYDPKTCYSPTYVDNRMTSPHGRHVHDHDMRSPCTSPQHMTVPPCASYYDPQFLNASPHVPVCLKEIEVKSIGTQSVRKMSLLQKLTNKMQVPVQQANAPSPKQSSSRTPSKDKATNNLFDWKKIHEKAMQKTTDPHKFSYNTQKRLAEGDNTMRNVMLKKLFYKRNPFSPRNLLVRTLLGKDRSSFGEPPKMYKPKMFL